MAVPRELIRQIRRLDEYELRRLLIVVRGLLTHVDGPPVDDPDLPPHLTYRQEHVRCGKAGCTTCPHGPYWYAYWKEDGRTRKRYIGRHLAGEPLEPVVPDGSTATADPAPTPAPAPPARATSQPPPSAPSTSAPSAPHRTEPTA